MSNYRLTLQYDGGRYDGWQRMGKDESDNTIYARIAEVLRKMTGAEPEINCGCRTEKGVHAYGQVINVKINDNPAPIELKNYLNRYLPRDIAVLVCDNADDRFHASLNAKSVTYVYRLDVGNIADVFQRKYTYHTFDMPDIDAMRKAAECLLGTHEFDTFTDQKDPEKSTRRTIKEIRIEQEGDKTRLVFIGDGFLYHMVRRLTGTLLEVGRGERSPQSVAAALYAKDPKKAGFLAPARGLFLREVYYKYADKGAGRLQEIDTRQGEHVFDWEERR